MRAVILFLCGVCFLLAAPPAQGWNEPGHMTSAAIAYADLKERKPDVSAKVIEDLKKHPQYESKWAPQLEEVSSNDRDLYLFMLAARWSDDIRGNDRYDHPLWHYVDIPFRPGDTGVEIPQVESILTAFPKNLSTVEGSATDAKARAVALCWMFHLIGDVHQPLHTTALVTEQYPAPLGDKGGNLFFIRATSDGSGIKLHSFWDGLVLGSKRFQSVRNKATELRNRPGFKREDYAEQLAVKPFNDWAAAAHTVAIKAVYRNGTLKGGTNKDNAVAVPDDYAAKAKEIAERQIVLSGYRLSDVMVDVFGK